jgi:hypothetical protein
MPCGDGCHTPNPGRAIETVVEVVNGKIRIRRFGGGARTPTLKEYLANCRKRLETFHYKKSGDLVVLISPCPKGC